MALFFMPRKRYHKIMKALVLFISSLLVLSPGAGAAQEFRFSPQPNKAHLIQWRSWGAAARDEARKKDRLILLSLSAVWCHWCHVMDETTYSDEEVISFVNDRFIPIRVDADMRPDVDMLYNQGGWPSTAILTPEGEVIGGGNYIPPKEMLLRLKRTVAMYREDRSSIVRRLDELRAMKDLRAESGAEGHSALPGKADLARIAGILEEGFDGAYGGFGSGQKFPNPDAIDLLLSLYQKDREEVTRKIIVKTLDRMAGGGMYDKIEGGFFRYATKPDWSEPHYEKMLDVNAGLIKSYADASLGLGNREYLAVALKTMRYVEARLSAPASGAFFGSQDADEAYYKAGDRKRLTPPAVDRTSYTDSSSLMISAMIALAAATGENQYLDRAARSAEFLLANLGAGSGGMYHYFRDNRPHLIGLLSDNALFGTALLDLYNATGRKRYREAASRIGALITERFFDGGSKRLRPFLDAAMSTPATAGVLSPVNEGLANYRAILFLSRLDFVQHDAKMIATRDAAAATFAGEYQRFSPSAATYGKALLWIVDGPVEVTVVAEKEKALTYVTIVSRQYIPEKAVRVLSPSEDAGEIAKLRLPLAEAVHLCAGKRCSKPITGTERLKKEIASFVNRPSGNK